MTTETTTELSPEVRELLWLCGSAFTGIIENDKTTYEPGEPRPDGKLSADVDGSARWVTPKQIAEALLPAIKETLGGEWE